VEPFQLGSDGLLRLVAWEKRWPALSAGFTTRATGNMAFLDGSDPHAVVLRRETLAHVLGFSFSGFTFAQQIHGTRVQVVDGRQRGAGGGDYRTALPGSDGLSTGLAETVLLLYYADCVPMYFYGPEKDVVALAHAGWRGTTGNMAARMIEHYAHVWGIGPKAVWVAIGPSIGACCYEVDDPVIQAVRKVLPDEWQAVCRPKEGRWLLDLKELNRRLLMAAGVPQDHICTSRYCTACRQDLFFSYRKEGTKAGRMLAWIGRKEGEGR